MPLFSKSSIVKAIEIDHDLIHAGQMFSGRVSLDVSDPSAHIKALVVQLVGVSEIRCDSSECKEKHNQTYPSNKIVMSEFQLLKGQHTLEFSLTAPEQCPSSFNGNRGFVTYHVHLQLESNNKKENHKKIVKVVGGSPIQQEGLCHSVQMSNNGLNLTFSLLNGTIYKPGDKLSYRVSGSWGDYPLTKIKAKLVEEVIYCYPKDHRKLSDVQNSRLGIGQQQFNPNPNLLPHKNTNLEASLCIPTDTDLLASFLHDIQSDDFHPVQVRHYIHFEAAMRGVAVQDARLPITIRSKCSQFQLFTQLSQELLPTYESCIRSQGIKF